MLLTEQRRPSCDKRCIGDEARQRREGRRYGRETRYSEGERVVVILAQLQLESAT